MTTRGTLGDSLPRRPVASEDEQTWMDKENSACNFRDERLKKRFRLLLKQFWTSMGQSIPYLRQSTELFGDPQRCVHIGDRESDIYELFCTAQDVGTHFLVRTCVDRLAGDGGHTIAQEMEEVNLKGLRRVRTSAPKGNVVDAVLEIRYRRIRVLPPIEKQSRYPALSLTVIHARERDTPTNRKPIEWKLIIDLPTSEHRHVARHAPARGYAVWLHPGFRQMSLERGNGFLGTM